VAVAVAAAGAAMAAGRAAAAPACHGSISHGLGRASL